MGYWEERLEKAQNEITQRNQKDIEKQLSKYYEKTMKRVIDDFENTYDKLLATTAAGKTPVPADLYKLDKYWKLQADLRVELEKLGNKEIALLSRKFEEQFLSVYKALEIEGMSTFTTLDLPSVQQMINNIWVADGKTYSQRIWDNTNRLLETLNEELTHCVVAGRNPRELRTLLRERFGVSYRRADTLVRTELCHIQTLAAQQRYKDYGIEYVEVLVEDSACPLCKEIRGKRFLTNATPPLPVHPNERCCLIPVID